MIGYLGTTGALAKLEYRHTTRTVNERPVRPITTLGGRRKAFMAPAARREWDISFGVLPSEDMSGLEAALYAPATALLWYPEESVAGNLLSPQATTFASVSGSAISAGLVSLPDGSVAHTIASDATVRVGDAHGDYEMVPLAPGEPVSVGAWSIGGQHFRGLWRDATGASITSWTSSAKSWAGWGWHEVTLTPPVGAAFIELHLAGSTQYARPSISWGAAAKDRPGRGCPSAVIESYSHGVFNIDRRDTYSTLELKIIEVG